MSHRTLAVLLTLCLILASCGGSGDDAVTDDETLADDEVGHLELVQIANYGEYADIGDYEVVSWREQSLGTSAALGACFNDVTGDDGRPDGEHDHRDSAAFFDPTRVFIEGEWVDVDPGRLEGEQPILVGDFVTAIADQIEGARSIGLDYVLMPSMTYGLGTGDDPTPALGTTDQLAGRGGDGLTITVVDTGLPPKTAVDNISGPVTSLPPNSRYHAHGLMVASAAHQILPEADITVVDATTNSGVVTAWSAGEALKELAESDAFVFPLGTYGCAPEQVDFDTQSGTSGEPYTVDVGLDASAIETLVEIATAGDALVVAAAGNDATDRPFWPASDVRVAGAGAIDASIANREECITPQTSEYVWDEPTDGCEPAAGLAPFSNFGVNVDGEAPGVDLVVHYAPTPYDFTYIDGTTTATLVDWVRASGTSLAAPVWAACNLATDPAPICDDVQ